MRLVKLRVALVFEPIIFSIVVKEQRVSVSLFLHIHDIFIKEMIVQQNVP